MHALLAVANLIDGASRSLPERDFRLANLVGKEPMQGFSAPTRSGRRSTSCFGDSGYRRVAKSGFAIPVGKGIPESLAISSSRAIHITYTCRGRRQSCLSSRRISISTQKLATYITMATFDEEKNASQQIVHDAPNDGPVSTKQLDVTQNRNVSSESCPSSHQCICRI
jgi:hypothetical protein